MDKSDGCGVKHNIDPEDFKHHKIFDLDSLNFYRLILKSFHRLRSFLGDNFHINF